MQNDGSVAENLYNLNDCATQMNFLTGLPRGAQNKKTEKKAQRRAREGLWPV